MVVDSGFDVWFVCELDGGDISPLTFGLAAQARRIAGALGCKVVAVLLGPGAGALAPRVSADVVLAGEHEFVAEGTIEAAAATIGELAQRSSPLLLLLTDSSTGSDLAPRLAARLGTGLASACVRIDVTEDGSVLMLRHAYGGRASCTVECPPGPRPHVATLVPQAISQAAPPDAAAGKVSLLDLGWERFRPRAVLQRIEQAHPSSMDVTQADVVIAGGRGVGGPNGFALLEELAGLLGGTVGASRPAVDAGWTSPGRQVGSSGKMVAPRLYVACGISGASQHLAGMKASQSIVAVNPDPYAEIVAVADLALIGDVNELLPVVLGRLRESAAGCPSGAEAGLALPDAAVEEDAVEPDAVRVIAACVSRSLDPEAVFDPRNPEELQAAARFAGPEELQAVEAALSIRESYPAAKVVAVHLGDPGGEADLRRALAMGADEAHLLWDASFVDSDSLCSARILARAVSRLGATLVFCGNRGDGDGGQLPVQLGELLGFASLKSVLSVIASDGGGLTVRRRLDRGRRAVIRCRPPAVIAVEPGAEPTRYPRLRDRLAARSATIDRWDAAALELSGDEIGRRGSSIRIVKVGLPKPVAETTAAAGGGLSADERLQAILGGGVATATGGAPGGSLVVRGTAAELADAFLHFLAERRVAPVRLR